MAEDSESGPPSGRPDDGSPETADASDAEESVGETGAVTPDSELASDTAGVSEDGESDPDPVGSAATGREIRDETPYGDRSPDADGSGDSSLVEPGNDAVETGDSLVKPVDDAGATATAEAEAGAVPTGDRPTVEAETVDDLDDGLVGEGPASDEEMPLAAHIEEMIRRLAVVLVVGGVVALAVFPVADQLINFLWNAHIPGAENITDRRPRLYGPLELVVTELKVAALAGFVVGLPVAVYETYLFMKPGLFPRERRYYLAAVPTSLVLALIGVAFAHFVVLPAIFAYFTAYTTGTAVVAFGLKETFSLILVLMGYMALVFQIPLFIMLAIMMNLTTREWLEGRRLLFWGGFLGVAFLVSPDPTGMAPIIVAATMIGLFEGTLALLRWTGN
jgi:sec-independent protein translocase protein TatC